MVDGTLKIVEIKKDHKKLKKALLSKCFNSGLVVLEAWCVCFEAHEFLETKKISNLVLTFCMLYWYYQCLKRCREDTEVINDNLDKELDLEEQVEEELVK